MRKILLPLAVIGLLLVVTALLSGVVASLWSVVITAQGTADATVLAMTVFFSWC